MPRPITVTYEAVAKTAATLVAGGTTASVRRVVEVIGGSNSDVAPLLRRWKQEIGDRQSTSESMPFEISNAVNTVMKRVREELRQELEEEIRGQLLEISELTSSLSDANLQVATLRDANLEVSSQRDRLQGQVSQQCSELEALRLEQQTSRQIVEDSRTELAKAAMTISGQDSRLQDALASEANLKMQWADMQSRFARAEKGQADAEGRLAVASAEFQARLAVEQEARDALQRRLLELTGMLDAERSLASRVAAAEAAEKVLRDQVLMLSRLLDAGAAGASEGGRTGSASEGPRINGRRSA